MTNRKRIWIYVGLVLLIGLIALPLWRTEGEIFRDHRVIVTERRTLVNYLSVHASPRRYLHIYGKTIAGIRGMPPFYLELKPIGAILFVAEDPQHRVTIILAYDQTKEVVTIPAGVSGFGRHIGSKRAAGDSITDYVESASAARIVLAWRGLDWTERITINVTDRVIESVQTSHDQPPAGSEPHKPTKAR